MCESTGYGGGDDIQGDGPLFINRLIMEITELCRQAFLF
jgi:hypothetical protein